MNNTLLHYGGICAVILVAYFALVAPFLRHEEIINAQNAVRITEPTPSKQAALLNQLIEALKNKDIYAAMQGNAAQQSAASQAVATAISDVTGANAKLADALAAGLLKPSPKTQVITVANKPTAGTSTTAETNSQIKKDLAAVLNDPKTKVHVTSDIRVTYEDRPFSPVFAVYDAHNRSGLGYTLKGSKPLDLDALLMKDSGNGLALGSGVEHVFRGTSAGVGVGVVYDFGLHKPTPVLYVGVHF